MRKYYVKKKLAKRPLPSLEQVMNCVMRCNLDEPGMMEIFVQYADEILPKIAMSECWQKQSRLTSTISEATLPNGKASVPPQTEAFLLVVWINCIHRWKYIVECNKKGVSEDRKSDEYQVPFTSDKQGQQKWGGWNKAGKEYYNEAVKLCMEGRAKEATARFEQECLELIQKKHRVEEKKAAKTKEVVVDGEETELEMDQFDDFE